MNGIINVYKEKGYTSHDVVAKLRGICHQKKIGHTGTLDPDAEGVLPVCLGTSTKVCALLTDKDKEYEAQLLLGKETDTQDTSGSVLKEADVSVMESLTEEAVRNAILSFVGTYQQIPPMYSAIKVGGKKLCDLARKGIEVEREARQVTIYGITVLWMRLPVVKIKVHCSKGTYIRTLCHDIGQKLGCGGCMAQLLRTRVGSFGIDSANRISQIEEVFRENDQERIAKLLCPVDQLFFDYPAAVVQEEYYFMLKNGNRLPLQAFYDYGKLLLPCHEGADGRKGAYGGAKNNGDARRLRVYMGEEFFGIYAFDMQRSDYKPVKIFWRRN